MKNFKDYDKFDGKVSYDKTFKDFLSMDNFSIAEGKTFHVLLRERIEKFTPVLFHTEKSLFMAMAQDGAFIPMKIKGVVAERYDLSASDRTIFNYLCWLEVVKFLQEVAGLHGEELAPLQISNFTEYLDEKVDVQELLKKAYELGRRVVVDK